MSAQEYTAKVVADFAVNPPKIVSVTLTQVSPVPPVIPPPVTPPQPPTGNLVGRSFNELSKVQLGVVVALVKWADSDIAEKVELSKISDISERNRLGLNLAQRENGVIANLNVYKGLAETARAADRTGVNPQVLGVIDAGKRLLSGIGASPLPTATTPPTPSRADWSVLFEEIKAVDVTKELMAARDRWDAAHS